jgi:hypothetical protein
MPKPYHEQKYVLLPDELKKLWVLKLINDHCYVYLALRMTYGHSNPSVNLESFSEAWNISEENVRVAIAALQKKGCLETLHKQLELELFTTDEAIANVEEAKMQAKEQKKTR